MRMVEETYHRLTEAHGDKFRIACMGVDQSGTTDMFNEFLEAAALRDITTPVGFLSTLDSFIEDSWNELQRLADKTDAPHIELLEALCHLLSCREKYLIASLYQTMHENK
jgi:hypothetical protein